jgi:hypothetical protein
VTTSDGNTPQEKIAKIIEKAAPASPKRSAALPQVVVYGNGPVTVTSGDVHIHHYANCGRGLGGVHSGITPDQD